MKYLGDFAEDYATLNFKFSTHKADGTPITLAGTPAVSVYKANNTTQSTAGVTLTVDFDSVTGLHNVLVDLSSDAFYAAGEDYDVVITTGTVDSVSVVGTVLAHFSIENRFNEADMTKIAGSAVDSAAAQLGVNVVNWKGAAAAAMTGDAYARLGAPAGASVSADISDLHTDVGDVHTDVGTVLTNLATVDGVVDDILTDTGTTIPGTLATIAGYIDTEIASLGTELAKVPKSDGEVTFNDTCVGDIKSGLTTAVMLPANFVDLSITDTTGLVNVADKTGFSLATAPPTAAQIKTAMEAAGSSLAQILEDTGTTLDGKINTIDGNVDSILEDTGTTIPATLAGLNDFDPATDVVAHVTLVDTCTTNTDMVAAAPTKEAIADQVWDETMADHVAAGSTGNKLNAAGAAGDPWSTALPGAYGVGTAGKILGDQTFALTAAAVDAIHDEVVEGTLTSRQIMRVLLASLAGLTAGGGTASITFRDVADAKDRIAATVDLNGNRTVITIDGT